MCGEGGAAAHFSAHHKTQVTRIGQKTTDASVKSYVALIIELLKSAYFMRHARARHYSCILM